MVAPGPVRNLECHYRALPDLTLSCDWKEPEQTYSSIQFYNVNLTHNGKIIAQDQMKALKWELKCNLTQNEIYAVSVGMLNQTDYPVVETRVHFIHSDVQASFSCSQDAKSSLTHEIPLH